MGSRAIRIICNYWDWITIVANNIGYHDPPVIGFQDMTQGDPLLSTIFNTVVDAFMFH